MPFPRKTSHAERITLGPKTYVAITGAFIDQETERRQVSLSSCSHDVRRYCYQRIAEVLNGTDQDAIQLRVRISGSERLITAPDLVECDFETKFGIVSLSIATDGRHIDLYFHRRRLTGEPSVPIAIPLGGRLLGRLPHRLLAS